MRTSMMIPLFYNNNIILSYSLVVFNKNATVGYQIGTLDNFCSLSLSEATVTINFLLKLKPRLHYDSDNVTILSSTIRIV